MLTRETCARCERPVSVCWCAHLATLPTRTRVLLLQHPRERRVGVGTARMAHLSLPQSTLRVGIDFAADAIVRASITDQEAPAYLLFPGPTAIDVVTLPRDRTATIVVLDGTWWQARKLLRSNPALAALPRVAFSPRAPSAYRIREQPAPFCVSTIEALAEVLRVLEPDGGAFERLLDPFTAMVARQEWFETTVSSRRHRRPRGPARPSPRQQLATRLGELGARVVCVHGEANAWPRNHPDAAPAELVHWVAERPFDDSAPTFDRVLAPRGRLAPSTERHIGVSSERLRAGDSIDGWRAAWDGFVRADDVLVSWGRYYVDRAREAGLDVGAWIDLRAESARALGRRIGSVEHAVKEVTGGGPDAAIADRAGRRLAALVAVTRALLSA